ncbi:MAG: hypothetical protein ABSG02_20295 [Terriglobales bacterium]
MRLLFHACLGIAATVGLTSGMCAAQDLRAPSAATAGENATVSTTGSGKATFYLAGPGVSNKSEVSLGNEIPLRGQDLRDAGQYFAILCSDSCHSASFYVTPAKPASLAFLVHRRASRWRRTMPSVEWRWRLTSLAISFSIPVRSAFS